MVSNPIETVLPAATPDRDIASVPDLTVSPALLGPEMAAPPTRPVSGLRNWGRRARRSTVTLKLALVMVTLYLVAGIGSLFWTPYGPTEIGAGLPFLAPSSEHWMGTDQLGVDVFSQLLAATRLDVLITITAVIVAFVVGSTLGIIAGYGGGWFDTIAMRLLEVLQSFPTLLLALLIVQVVGPGVPNLIVIMAIVGIPEYVRLARAEAMMRRSWPFVEAARMTGNRPWRIVWRHLFPNCLGPLVAFTSVNAAWVILTVSSLGYIGVGLEPGTPEWGSMISRGQSLVVTGEWWASFFPGLAILGFAGTLYLLGDALSDMLDPRRKQA